RTQSVSAYAHHVMQSLTGVKPVVDRAAPGPTAQKHGVTRSLLRESRRLRTGEKLTPNCVQIVRRSGGRRSSAAKRNLPHNRRDQAGGVEQGSATARETTEALPVRSPTEDAHPGSSDIDTRSAGDVVATILADDAAVAAAVAARAAAITTLVQRGVQALAAGGRILYVGAGTSGRLAVLDAAELLPTYGVGPDQVRGHIAGGERAMLHPVEGVEDDLAGGEAAVA